VRHTEQSSPHQAKHRLDKSEEILAGKWEKPNSWTETEVQRQTEREQASNKRKIYQRGGANILVLVLFWTKGLTLRFTNGIEKRKRRSGYLKPWRRQRRGSVALRREAPEAGGARQPQQGPAPPLATSLLRLAAAARRRRCRRRRGCALAAPRSHPAPRNAYRSVEPSAVSAAIVWIPRLAAACVGGRARNAAS
jgi:hypothetical protein